MRQAIFLVTVLLLLGCSDTQLVDYWKSPDIDAYSPGKVLVIGLTSDQVARQEFENQLKKELELRGAEVERSLDFSDFELTTDQITEKQINSLEDKLLNEGFDTILLTRVVGVEDKVVYRREYKDYDEAYRSFRDDYLRHQRVLYNPEYRSEYTVYHVETVMYCICPTKDRALIWKGYVDIIDPKLKEAKKTIKRYVNLVIVAMEELSLVNPQLEPLNQQ
ncbi:MAG: hypothetical protein HKP48_07150 [Winogradskyella sp.]|uniref:hypothetical protein n=1 Tax=Winogradskyella sp. TaxID=1883156 RepID=UPI0018458446|nr:hypothetical protein [Winogradskyella sp.]MBT8245869.1 hypothetical protein [Winogradskyella sp.]NNK23060.1 hypothetical protein [Winogradskyella sp.]